jgi:spoIIIJ-associated protein
MNSVEAEGNSIDEAIESALKRLGTSRERVEIEIVSSAARGFFGIGGRKARIRATLRKPIDAESLTDAPSLDEDPPTFAAEPHRTEYPAEPAADAGRLAEHARQVLQEIVDRVCVPAAVTVEEQDQHVLLELKGDSSGVLIGRRGQMLDALEYLVNRIVARDESGSARVVIDSQDYRERRRLSLEDLARRMGEQAKKKRKAVTLNPMSPRDRRIVHLVLQGDAALTTRSSGKGYFRKLVIIPAGAGRPTRGEG